MIFKTRYQRGKAVCDLLRDLSLRSTNTVIKEYCDISVALISAPAESRAAVEPRTVELLAAAESRLKRVGKV